MTEDRVLKSIELAERFARIVVTMEELEKDDKTPAPIVEDFKISLQRIQKEIDKDLLAQKLLPQAIIREKMARAREKAIVEGTFIGRLKEQISLIENDLACGKDYRQIIKDIVLDNYEDSQVLKRFLGSISSRKARRILDNVSELLAIAVADLIYAKLPPEPPEIYKNPIEPISGSVM
ncbi:MAG: hypothetical protein Q7S32_01435 [bacterium]|nr:hypothetical protein [bacterium]